MNQFPKLLFCLAVCCGSPLGSIAAVEPVGQTSRVFAFTEPNVTVHVAFSQPGRIETLQVDEGQQVELGDPLAALETGALQVSQAIAKVRAADQSTITAAQAETDALQARLTDLSALQQSGGASPEEVRRISTELDVARAKLATAKSEKEVQKLEVKQLAEQLKQRNLTAPLSGYVTEIQKRAGEYVSAGDPQVLELVQLDPLKIRFYLPAADTLRRESGQPVLLHLPLLQIDVQGKIRRVSPVIDPESGTALVEVELANPDRTYRSGMRCELRLDQTAVSPSELSAQVSP
ncbi:efflux RND transporter periplasmic adaptor subunit [Stieleria sp. TO1_6]|uniref:efflux RND transporter periplasmic adaptor subunit n=1 Tax=Stieleria tagensis TaxID=2956795 RepID=UPI00209BA1CA|nr:efflux RND transporter periplasmic adaptor subunit [Stieleria tagensis]MCO8124321.1 efflux RND transporter periplasmic adaptor subunit [Stieleria tagensis]